MPDMRIAYAIPGPMHATALGRAEVARRGELLRGWAAPGTDTGVLVTDEGPASIESMYEEYLSIVPLARRVLEAERDGYDAVIVGCFGDPGLDGLREIATRPVVGPAQASMALAATLGHRFSVVTVADSVVQPLRRLAWETGVTDALASVRAVNLAVLDIGADHGRAAVALRAEAERALAEDGADTLVLGCMSMGFLDVAERLGADLGVPVINPVKAALHLAETLVRMGLAPSRRAYHTPPKVAAGTPVSGLRVTAEPFMEETG